MAVINTERAMGQLVFAISTPTVASDRPMIIITGPITTDGNIFPMNFKPHTLMMVETTP